MEIMMNFLFWARSKVFAKCKILISQRKEKYPEFFPISKQKAGGFHV